MKMFGKNLTENYKRKLKITPIVFSIILMSGAATCAQSIDDVLKPKPSIAQPKSPAKTPAKTIKKPSGGVVRKSSPAKNKPSNTLRQAVAYSSETPDQILNRFMDFRQSSGVTNRDWNNVIAQTTKILKSNPNHSMAKAQSLIAQGQIAYNGRDYSMAITHFKSALQILPGFSVLHYSLGRAYLANGQAKAAEDSFEEAVDQNKNFALAYKGIGDAAQAQGENGKAKKYFKKATEISIRDGNMTP